MKPIRLCGVLILLGAAATFATACPPVVVRQSYYAPYVAPTYAAPYVAPVATVAVPVLVPLYTAQYGGTDQGTAALLAELKALREAVRTMQQQQVAPAQAPAMPPAAAAPARAPAPPESGLLQARCAACHSGAAAKGGVRMFDGGKRIALAPEKLGDAIEAVVKGTMPKDRKLTDTEVRAVLADLIK